MSREMSSSVSPALLTLDAASLANQHNVHEVTVLHPNLDIVVAKLDVPQPENPVVLVRARGGHTDGSDPFYRKAEPYDTYQSGFEIDEEHPAQIRKFELKDRTVLEGTLYGQWDNQTRFTHDVAYDLQEPERRRHVKQAIIGGIGSIAGMGASVVAGVITAKQTGDPSTGETVILLGTGASGLAGLAMLGVQLFRGQARAAKRKAVEHIPLLHITRGGQPSAS